MSSYLTREQAEDRLLSRFGVDASLSEGDVDLASDEVDAMGPFMGDRLEAGQARAFPRTWLRPGDEAGVVPEAVLDAVCLLAKTAGEDDTPVQSERVMSASQTFAVGRVPREKKRAEMLLKPYKTPAGDGSYSGWLDF